MNSKLRNNCFHKQRRGSTFSILAVLLFSLLLAACNKMFDYSPYEVNVPDSYKNTTHINLERLKAKDKGIVKPFKIALISDTHYYYDDLQAIVDNINGRDDIDFILVLGDLADQGMLTEYMHLHDILDKSTKPYLTVIGNHDYLSNGEKIYDQVFGSRNYSFTYNKVRFVMFDNTFWESKTIPDFDWLQAALQPDSSVSKTIVCAHIPPFGDQFTKEYEDKYSKIISEAGVSISLHGHRHHYSFSKPYSDSIPYLVVPTIETDTYCELTVSESDVQVNTIRFE